MNRVDQLRHPAWIVAGASLWMTTAGNAPLWRALGHLGLLDGAAGWTLAGGLGLLVWAGLAALLSLLAWRWTLKPAVVLLLLATACASYFMLRYGIVVDAGMLTNVLQTDARESADLLSPGLALTVLALAGVPAWLLWRQPVAYGRWQRQLLRNPAMASACLLLVVVAVLVSFQPLASAMRNHRELRYLINPLNAVYALGRTAARPLERDGSRMLPLGEDGRLGAAHAARARPPLLLLVLGETGRAGNFGLNGYARPTTPELERAGVASFRNVWSCGTSTAASVPCMFSHLGRDGFERRTSEVEGLLDVLQRAGLAVLWVDNQSGCKGVCDRVPHVSTAQGSDPRLCPGGECLDEVMLEGLDRRIDALPAGQRARGVVVVLHQMGSHGPAYSKRSPAALKRFLPECTDTALQDCSREALVNAYDNSIAYTDHFLARSIVWLQRHADSADAAMVYVADHGESLGENNLFLHGLPYAIAPDVQKRVPWISWLSGGYRSRSGIGAACLEAQRDAPLSHDNYFHSVLGLLDVQSAVYRRELDVYARCTAP